MFRFCSRAQSALTLLLTVSAAALVTPHSAVAQQQPTLRQRRDNATRRARIQRNIEAAYSNRWEIAGGGGFLRFRSGEFLQKNNEVTWTTSVTRNFNPTWGVVGDIRGMYGNAKVGNNIFNVYKPLITEYTFMGGVQYRFVRKEKYAVSAQVLGGAAMGNFDGGSKGIASYRLGMWDTSAKPVFSAGVNVDYNFYPNFAFRVTPTYVGTLFNGGSIDDFANRTGTQGSFQNNFGFNAGVVYRFGK